MDSSQSFLSMVEIYHFKFSDALLLSIAAKVFFTNNKFIIPSLLMTTLKRFVVAELRNWVGLWAYVPIKSRSTIHHLPKAEPFPCRHLRCTVHRNNVYSSPSGRWDLEEMCGLETFRIFPDAPFVYSTVACYSCTGLQFIPSCGWALC